MSARAIKKRIAKKITDLAPKAVFFIFIFISVYFNVNSIYYQEILWLYMNYQFITYQMIVSE